MLHIRSLLADDLPAVLTLQAQCYGDGLPESGESLAAKRAASPDTCFLACDPDGAALAYLFSLPWRAGSLPPHNAPACALPALPDCIYLHDLAVSPAARGSGAAGLMVARFFTAARALALPQACLVAVQASAPFWARHGFAVVDDPALRPASLASYGEAARYMARLL